LWTWKVIYLFDSEKSWVKIMKLQKLGRQHFVTLIKFAPGKGPEHVEKFAEIVDKQMKSNPSIGKTRHEMDIHERESLVMLGDYDMIIYWDGPNMETVHTFLIEWINLFAQHGFGTTKTLMALSRGNYQ